MAYNGLTNLGVEYLARMTAENKPVTFTKIKVGNGSIPASQTGASTTNLYSLKKEVEILSKNQIENSIKLQVLLNNLDLEVGFYVKELGVYVQDGEQEKLYWYINKDNPSYLPDKNTPSTHRYNLFLEVSNFETNIINFTGEGLLADKKFVEDSIEEAFNNFEEGYNATINTLLPKGNIPNSLNSAEKIVAALQGNGGLKFDENLLYLNDEGTKKKGLYYLDRLAEGIFECLEQTDEKVNNSAKFKNISNKENSDRLDNLSKKELLFSKGAVKIYRVFNDLGLLTFNSSIDFKTGTLVGNTYKYYYGDMEIEAEFNISDITHIVNMWSPIMLHMVNSNHHTFCELSIHGISQCVGNGKWSVQCNSYVKLLI